MGGGHGGKLNHAPIGTHRSMKAKTTESTPYLRGEIGSHQGRIRIKEYREKVRRSLTCGGRGLFEKAQVSDPYWRKEEEKNEKQKPAVSTMFYTFSVEIQ